MNPDRVRHNEVELAPFSASYLGLLEDWLSRPHVARWFTDTRGDLEFARTTPPNAGQALVCVRSFPVGYLRWRRVGREQLDAMGLSSVPDGSVDVDILVGEDAWLGRGVGPCALEHLVDRLALDPAIPLIGVSTAPINVRAQIAFEKAGFTRMLDYDPGEGVPYALMVRDPRDCQAIGRPLGT